MKKGGTSLVAVATLAVVISAVAGASYNLMPHVSPQMLKLFVTRDARNASRIYESPGGLDYELRLKSPPVVYQKFTIEE